MKFRHLLTFLLQAFNIKEMNEDWNAKSTIKNTPKFSEAIHECEKMTFIFIFYVHHPFKRNKKNIPNIRKNLKMDLELGEPQLKYWLESCLWSPISSTTCQYYECPVAITALRNEQYRLILPLLLWSAGLQSSNSFY